ncbi:MAG: hypothetical protein FWD27_00205 [Coriobacteriia bacterium]|nr:hypothetical protein [Coriobacteriia bacterium]
METQSKKLDDNKREITVTLTSSEVQKEIDSAYREAAKNRIPGFRPGKAPRKILENHFGGEEFFLAQATEDLVQAYTPLAPDELQLVTLGNPEFEEFGMVVSGQPFTFTFSIEVVPELELSSYDPIKIELPSSEPTEDEIQMHLDTLLSYNISKDDDGNVSMPELTDEWVKETLEYDSVETLKQRLADSIRQQREYELSMIREMKAGQELSKLLVGEVPESLVRQTEQENYRELFQSLQKQRTTFDAYIENYGLTPEAFREEMKTQAFESSSMSLALDALARHFEMIATDEEIMQEFEKSGLKDPKKLYEDWRKSGRLSEIRQGIVRMKASQHMMENLEIFEIGQLYPIEESESSKETPAKKSKKASATGGKTDNNDTEAAAKSKAPRTTKTKSTKSESQNGEEEN